MSMYCPFCFDANVTPYRLIGSTQYYICGNCHKFSNPIIFPDDLTAEQAAEAASSVTTETQTE